MKVVTMRMSLYLKEEINLMDHMINLLIKVMKEKKMKIHFYVAYAKIVMPCYRENIIESM